MIILLIIAFWICVIMISIVYIYGFILMLLNNKEKKRQEKLYKEAVRNRHATMTKILTDEKTMKKYLQEVARHLKNK